MIHSRLIAIGFAMFILLPSQASAHEHQTFEIGTKTYDFTIGSQNEPVIVDDKTGVELNVWTAGSGAAAVSGLESTLKVELQADGEKKMMDLSAAWDEPGSYYATFYPTADTTYSYRVTGTIDAVPVDLLFTCSPAGHEMHAAQEDTSRVKISDTVTRIKKAGRFGCPKPKEAFGFPSEGATLRSLRQKTNTALAFGIIGMTFGIIGMGAARRKDTH